MCFGFIFLFLNDLRRPSFFFFFPAQAFTKWPPVFSGETRRISVANGSFVGPGRTFGYSGDPLCRYRIKRAGSAGLFKREVIF